MTGVAGGPGSTRRLILNADDFGQSPGINDGIIRCHESGVVTSASLMVRWPWAPAAAEYARREPALSIGLHLDIGEWVHADGDWHPIYEVVDPNDSSAIARELARQLEMFQRLMHRDPTHLDSHQHVHRGGSVCTTAMEMADRLGVPIRGTHQQISYCGEFYGQTAQGRPVDGVITVDRLIGILTTLPTGATEIGCHPGLQGDAPGMYVAEREQEVRVLCDPRVRATLELEGLDLISFHDLPRNSPGL